MIAIVGPVSGPREPICGAGGHRLEVALRAAAAGAKADLVGGRTGRPGGAIGGSWSWQVTSPAPLDGRRYWPMPGSSRYGGAGAGSYG
jgi:hypothetical protein